MNNSPKLEVLAEVLARTHLGKTTLYELVATGKFPLPVRLSAQRVAWRSEEIDSFIASLQPVARPSAGAVWTAPQAQPAAV